MPGAPGAAAAGQSPMEREREQDPARDQEDVTQQPRETHSLNIALTAARAAPTELRKVDTT